MEARKTIENKREGEYQIIKRHVIDIKENIQIEVIAESFGVFDEDGETAYFDYGVCFNPDGEIFCIDANKFISGISKQLEENQNEDYWRVEKEEHEEFEKELKKLEKYKGYDIYL